MNTPQLALGLRFPPDSRLDTFRGPPVGLLDVLAALASGEASSTTQAGLFLVGASGSGKTHLLLATCAAADAARVEAAYLPLRLFGARAADALVHQGTPGLACIDDVEAIAGDRDAEVALFDLHNRVRDAGGTLVYTSATTPAHLDLALPDLRSRLAQGTRFALAVPDEDQRRAILCDRAATRGFDLDEAVLDYLLRRVGRDLATLTALLDRLDRASLAARRRITVPFLKDVIDGG